MNKTNSRSGKTSVVIIIVAAVLVLAAVAFAVCFKMGFIGGKEEPTTAEAPTQQEVTEAPDEGLDSYLTEKGKLTIGFVPADPFIFYDDAGSVTGIEAEFAMAVCDRLGLAPEFVEVEGDPIDALNEGKVDVLWGACTKTSEDTFRADFTFSYLFDRQVVLCSAETAGAISSKDDLEGRSSVAEKGSAAEAAIQAEMSLVNDYSTTETDDEALELLLNGDKELMVTDITYALYAVENNEGLEICDNIPLKSEEYAVAIRLENPGALIELENAMVDVANSGLLHALAPEYGVEDMLQQ